MKLNDIVAISGKSGLHKVIGRSRNGVIVETIGSGVKFSTGFQDKVSVLSDISMYTINGDMKLAEVFIKLKESGNVPEPKTDLKTLRKFLIDTIQLDSERVYDNDIKKLINWYHTLKDLLDFNALTETETADTENENTNEASEQTVEVTDNSNETTN